MMNRTKTILVMLGCAAVLVGWDLYQALVAWKAIKESIGEGQEEK